MIGEAAFRRLKSGERPAESGKQAEIGVKAMPTIGAVAGGYAAQQQEIRAWVESAPTAFRYA
jgi:hypothetical protein